MAAPYDIANDILNAARARVASEIATLLPVGGDILDRNQRETQQMLNLAWRKLESILADLGFARFEREIVLHLPAINPAVAADYSSRLLVDWMGCFDGAAVLPGPLLPSDMIYPLKVWERPHGLTNAFRDMDEILDGIPTTPKTQWLWMWEWRDDTLWTTGALLPTDLKIRYAAFMADFLDDGVTPWFMQPVPIVHCQDALSLLLCAELATAAKLPDAAAMFLADGKEAATRIYGRDTQEPTRTRKESERGRMRDERTPAPKAAQ